MMTSLINKKVTGSIRHLGSAILLETRINGVIFNRKLNNLIIKRCLESKNNNNNKKANKKQQNTKVRENLN